MNGILAMTAAGLPGSHLYSECFITILSSYLIRAVIFKIVELLNGYLFKNNFILH